MKYKLVIFDLDGTILDTLEDLTNSVNYALNKNKLAQRTIDEVRCFVGNGIKKLIERAVPSNTESNIVEQVFEDFKIHYVKHSADNTKPYQGIKEMIETLRSAGCKTAVVSNKADVAVGPLCESFFPNMFDIAIGEREGIRKKPSPDSVLEVLDRLNMEKKDAVYIGDSEVDIQTAANAGIDVISVNWGFRNEEFLREQGAQIIVKRSEEIAELVL